MTAKQIALWACTTPNYTEKMEELERKINNHTRHIAEQAVEVEKKVWCRTYERVFKDILSRINELTQTNEE